ncbi:MAG TPA: hypothetical protein PLO29_02515 [Paludibacter sp.]|jgi:hypothetical protein|nr:hypothetical protein [Paludibacter sp.]
MKTIFPFAFLMLLSIISYVSKCQNNLQFNQVLYISLITDYPEKDTTINVPLNKVWKIEGATCGYLASIEINGQELVGRSTSNYSYSSFPFWLPSGKYKLTIDRYTSRSDNRGISLSVIEFNLVSP